MWAKVTTIFYYFNLGYSCSVPYQNLTDSWRKIGSASGSRCDKSNHKFDGNTWFRFVGMAGTMLPTSPPGKSSCGTDAVSWMEGEHPKDIDSTVSRKICFRWDSQCQWPISNTNVRKCSDYDGSYFYIYQLKRPTVCNLGYCAVEKWTFQDYEM